MKKRNLLIVLISLMVLSISSTVFSAPYEVDLVYKQGFQNQYGLGNIVSATQDSSTTVITINNTRFITHTFSEPVTVNSTKLVYTGKPINVILTDSSGKEIFNKSVTSDIKTDVNLTDVKKMKVVGTTTTLSNLYLVRLYGFLPVINTEKSKFVINNLRYGLVNIKALTLNWDPVNSQFFHHYNVYSNGVLISEVNNASYSISGLNDGELYEFKVTAVDHNGDEYAPSLISYKVPDPDTIPPDDPTGIRVLSVLKTEASLVWNVNKEKDLAGYYIYLDGLKINTLLLKTNRFDFSGLKEDTDYNFEISAVDMSGNESGKSVLKFKTLGNLPVPNVPIVNGSGFNQGVLLNWQQVKYADKYIIYQDGIKIGETNKNFIKVTNLINGQNYNFQVASFNTSGQSVLSAVFTLKPDKNKAPPINLGYNLADLTIATSNWFGSLWLVIAFMGAMVVAFWVGRKIKTLF